MTISSVKFQVFQVLIVNVGQLTIVINEKVENKSSDSSDFSQAVTFSDLNHWDMQLQFNFLYCIHVLHSCIVFHRVKKHLVCLCVLF